METEWEILSTKLTVSKQQEIPAHFRPKRKNLP
jgi:hypothetical protein